MVGGRGGQEEGGRAAGDERAQKTPAGDSSRQAGVVRSRAVVRPPLGPESAPAPSPLPAPRAQPPAPSRNRKGPEVAGNRGFSVGAGWGRGGFGANPKEV